MEEDNNGINRRMEMLSRFRESLSRPLSERFFDEDELIDIFDYAGDVNDDYLRIEALMCASRFYPDSEDLRERKAIFYSQYSDDASTKYISDNTAASGMLWDIMRARHDSYKYDDEKEDALNKILANYNDLSDEEVIQLVDLASSLGQYRWLLSHFDILRSKVSYIPILLYEMSVIADINLDTKTSITMLEELTEMEPYNSFYWMMLAREYAAYDESEKAMTAIEYSLAINPSDPQAMLIKAKLLYTSEEHKEDEVIEILKEVLHIKPDIVEAVRLLASLYSDTGNKIMARMVLQDFLNKYPDEATSIIPDLIIYRPENTDQLLDVFYRMNEENSQMIWASWAHQLLHTGYDDLAVKLLEAYQRNSGLKIYTLFPIERLFFQRDYEGAIRALDDYLKNQENTETEFPTMVIIHLMSLIRLGEYEKAESFCYLFEKESRIDKFTTISGRLEFIGLQKLVRNIKNRLKKTKSPEDWEDFDPLGIWT